MPKRPKPGKVSETFGKPPPRGPNSCPVCGATPACVPPKHKGK